MGVRGTVNDGSGGNASDAEQWGVAGEALLAHRPLLTSYCEAQLGTPVLWYEMINTLRSVTTCHHANLLLLQIFFFNFILFLNFT